MSLTKTWPSARFNLLGQLRDKDKEKAFQTAQYPATRKRMRFVCAITAPAYLAAIYADSLQISGNALFALTGARALAVLMALATIIYSFKKNGTPARMGVFVCAYMIPLILTENFELALKAGLVALPETPITAFMILLFYLFLPPQIWQPFTAGTLGSASYLLTLTFLTDASSGHIANTFLVLALANGFGLYFAMRFGTVQRLEFTALSKLKVRAETDPLTGAYNRGKVMELATREFNAAKRYRYPCALLMLDIDHFKTVNDTYGHATGDIVLTGFAKLCSKQLRNVDLFGRIGGEEFIILMPHASCAEALTVAQRLLETIRNTPFQADKKEIFVTASIGAAEMNDTTLSLDKLLQTADTALYQAKKYGRDRTCEIATDGQATPDRLPT